jgi:hypothetical protein
VSDNGPQFVSAEFEKFCSSNGVRHSTSSAYHPRSNGEAERFVRTFKNAMSSCGIKDSNLSLCDFLLTYRVTPHATTGASPSELMMKRKFRTVLDLLHPDVNAKVRRNQEVQKEQFNGSSSVREFHTGQTVWVQSFSKDTPKWSLGTVVKATGPVSYQVDVDGRTIKRHVDHILSAELQKYNNKSEPLFLENPPDPVSPAASPAKQFTPTKVDSVPVSSPVRIPVSSPVREPEQSDVDPSTSDLNGTVGTSRYEIRRNRKPPERLNTSSFRNK